MATHYQAISREVRTAHAISLNSQSLRAHFLAILPHIETHARIRFRYPRCAGMQLVVASLRDAPPASIDRP